MKVRLFVALLLVPAVAEGGAFSWKKVEEEKRFKGFSDSEGILQVVKEPSREEPYVEIIYYRKPVYTFRSVYRRKSPKKTFLGLLCTLGGLGPSFYYVPRRYGDVNPYSEEDAERTERARTAFLGGLALAGIMGFYTLFGGGEERTTEVDSVVTELRGNNPVFTGRKVVLEPGGIFVRTDEDGRARLRIPEGLWREPVVTLYGMVDETRRDEGSAYQVVLGGEAPVVPAEVGDLLRELPSFAPAKDRFALLIGVSNYDDEAIPPVRCALNDVALMKGMAWKVMCVHPDNILTLEDPTQAQVRAGLRKVVEEASKRSNPWVLVYFSGHGTNVEGRPYWLPRDFDRNFPAETGISVEKVEEVLEGLPGDKLVVVDACYAGGGKSFTLAHRGIRVEPIEVRGRIVLLASSEEDQESKEIEDKGYGVFTYALYLTTRQGTFLDEDSDGWLSAGELEDALRRAVRSLVGASGQVPQVRGDREIEVVRVE